MLILMAGALLTVDDLLWFLYLYPLRFLSVLTPPALIYPLGNLYQLCARKRRAKAIDRMLGAPSAGIARDRAPRIASKFLANSSFRMLDDLILSWPSCTRRMRCLGIDGIEHLERGKAAGKGVILLTAHFSACRVAKRHLARIGYPILTVRQEISKGEWWGRLGRRILERRRVNFLHAIIGESVYVQDPGCTLKILRTLRTTGLVDIHFDMPSGSGTRPWPFLGVPWRFPTGIFELVRLSGCAVVPMLCLGRSSAFRIVFGPMLDIVSAPGRDEFVSANLPAFVETIEKQIRDYSEEWQQWMTI